MINFKSRFSQIIGNEKPYAWASRHGVAKATVSNVLNKNGLPSAEQLSKISDSTGVSIDWLLTGEGSMYRSGISGVPSSSSRTIKEDVDLIRDVVLVVEEVFEREGLSLPPDKKAELVSLLFEEVRKGEVSIPDLGNKVLRLVRFAS